MTCPGSVHLGAEALLLFGEGSGSDPALKGTQMHDIGEKLLQKIDLVQEDMRWCNSKGDIEEITVEEVFDCVQPYVEYVQSLEGDLFVETKVRAHEEVWGTSDAIVINENTMHVVDLKTGFITVDAEDNTQLMLYALGAHKEFGWLYDYHEIEVVISQGRTNHHSTYTYSVQEIETFEEYMIDAIKAVDDCKEGPITEGVLKASEKACQWCNAKTICPALATLVEEETMQDFRQMTLTQLGESMHHIPTIKAWIKGVEDQVKESMEKGDAVMGWKMVQGRTSRKWASEDQAIKYFKNRVSKFLHTCYNQKLKSPAQMEKALKGEDVKIRGIVNFEKVVEYGFSAPTIVPEADKREALVYGDQARADFEGVDVTE